DLSWAEMLAGGGALRDKVDRCRPQVVCLLGKDVYRAYAGLSRTRPVAWGFQAKPQVPGTRDFVMPNPSSRSTVPYQQRLALFRELQSAVAGNKSLINKLQNIEITGELTQEKLIDHAEELGVDLMADENGAIIIMNQKDLSKFVNLLNDDYMESNLTGQRYEIIKKKPLKPAGNDDMLAAGVELGDRFDFDVVHGHDWLIAHTGATLKEAWSVPLVATVHATEAGRHQGWLPGPLNQAINSIEWWLTYQARRVITCSQAMRWEVTRLFELPAGKVDVCT
ncbi:MAG: glycosyltransferase, partial [Bacillales bacterium]